MEKSVSKESAEKLTFNERNMILTGNESMEMREKEKVSSEGRPTLFEMLQMVLDNQEKHFTEIKKCREDIRKESESVESNEKSSPNNDFKNDNKESLEEPEDKGEQIIEVDILDTNNDILTLKNDNSEINEQTTEPNKIHEENLICHDCEKLRKNKRSRRGRKNLKNSYYLNKNKSVIAESLNKNRSIQNIRKREIYHRKYLINKNKIKLNTLRILLLSMESSDCMQTGTLLIKNHTNNIKNRIKKIKKSTLNQRERIQLKSEHYFNTKTVRKSNHKYYSFHKTIKKKCHRKIKAKIRCLGKRYYCHYKRRNKMLVKSTFQAIEKRQRTWHKRKTKMVLKITGKTYLNTRHKTKFNYHKWRIKNAKINNFCK